MAIISDNLCWESYATLGGVVRVQQLRLVLLELPRPHRLRVVRGTAALQYAYSSLAPCRRII